MSLPRMPDYISAQVLADVSYQHDETLIRTERLKGMPRQRRWTSAPMTTVDFRLFLENSSLDLFEVWYSEELKDGVSWFVMPFVYNGQEADRKCRFKQMYGAITPYTGTCYSFIPCVIEFDKRPLIDNGWLLMPEYYQDDGRKIFDLAMNREWPEA